MCEWGGGQLLMWGVPRHRVLCVCWGGGSIENLSFVGKPGG